MWGGLGPQMASPETFFCLLLGPKTSESSLHHYVFFINRSLPISKSYYILKKCSEPTCFWCNLTFTECTSLSPVLREYGFLTPHGHIYVYKNIKQNLLKSWTIECLRTFHVLNMSVILVTILEWVQYTRSYWLFLQCIVCYSFSIRCVVESQESIYRNDQVAFSLVA